MLGEGEDAEASEGRALPRSSPSVTAVSAVSTAAPSSAAPQPAASIRAGSAVSALPSGPCSLADCSPARSQ